MRFQVLDIVPHSPHPVTGELISVHERLERVVETAVLVERLGFDSYAVGERHAGEFVSSAPRTSTSRSSAWTSASSTSTSPRTTSCCADCSQQQEVLTRFAEEVAPLVRREVSSTLWGPQDPGRAKGFTAAD
jgi:hypothetical protein